MSAEQIQAFLSAQPAPSENPLDPVAPLSARTLASLREEVKTAGAAPGDVVRVTCYLSSLENLAATRMQVESEYPRAAASYVQNQRAPFSAVAACEAVARLPQRPGAPLKLAGGDSEAAPGQSRVALVGADRVVLTGTQSSFGYQEADTKLAFERIGAALKQASAGPNDVAWAGYYPLAPGIAGQLSRARLDFFGKDHQPAGTTLLFDGLPSMDAGFAIDLVAVRN
jgi:enamine deaminase RidA (YjgF/YER057c/UK114 family)